MFKVVSKTLFQQIFLAKCILIIVWYLYNCDITLKVWHTFKSVTLPLLVWHLIFSNTFESVTYLYKCDLPVAVQVWLTFTSVTYLDKCDIPLKSDIPLKCDIPLQVWHYLYKCEITFKSVTYLYKCDITFTSLTSHFFKYLWKCDIPLKLWHKFGTFLVIFKYCAWVTFSQIHFCPMLQFHLHESLMMMMLVT